MIEKVKTINKCQQPIRSGKDLALDKTFCDGKVLSPIREASGEVKRVKCQVNCGIGVATGDGRKQCNDGSPHPHCKPICVHYILCSVNPSAQILWLKIVPQLSFRCQQARCESVKFFFGRVASLCHGSFHRKSDHEVLNEL